MANGEARTVEDGTPQGMTFPDAHIAWQGVIDANPEHSVPFAVHVFIFHTVEQFQDAWGDHEAGAGSSTYDTVDDANIGAVIYMAKPDLYVSIVAHEATHIALNYHAQLTGRGGAKQWLRTHPEYVAEMVGNMTSLIWYGIPTEEEIDAEAS